MKDQNIKLRNLHASKQIAHEFYVLPDGATNFFFFPPSATLPLSSLASRASAALGPAASFQAQHSKGPRCVSVIGAADP